MGYDDLSDEDRSVLHVVNLLGYGQRRKQAMEAIRHAKEAGDADSVVYEYERHSGEINVLEKAGGLTAEQAQLYRNSFDWAVRNAVGSGGSPDTEARA